MNSTDPVHTKSQEAEKLIKQFAFGSGFSGFIPIPLLDICSLIGVQRLMLYRLSKLYGVPFKKNLGKAWITTLVGSATSSAATPLVGATLLKLIPGIGTAAGGISLAALGSASTYAIGRVFQRHFENGGTLENFDPKNARKDYEDALKEGKELSQEK